MSSSSEGAIDDGASWLRVKPVNDFMGQDWYMDCHGEPVSDEGLRMGEGEFNKKFNPIKDQT